MVELENETSYGNELTYIDTPEKIEKPTYISRTSIQHEMESKMENELMENADVMGVLASMIYEDKLNLVNVDADKRPVGKDGRALKDWNKLSYAELMRQHNENSLFWGLRNGFHAEGGRYTLSLDFDMCGETHQYRSCEETCALWNEYEQNTTTDGRFTSSTDGNMNVLVDYTNSQILQEKVKALGKNKVTVHSLEILLGGNQVIPPTMTKCKISGREERRRAFLDNPFYVIPDDDTPDFVRDFILRHLPTTVTRRAFVPVAPVTPAEDKWLDLLFNFIGNEVVNGAKKIPWNSRFHICGMLKSNGYSKNIWLQYNGLAPSKSDPETLWKSCRDNFPIFGLIKICNKANAFGLREWRNKHNQYINITVLQKGENDIAKYIAPHLEDVRYSQNTWWYCDPKTSLWSQRKDITAIVISTVQRHIDNALEILYFKKDTATEEEKEKLETQIGEYNKQRASMTKSSVSNQIIKCLLTYCHDVEFFDKLDDTIYQMVYKNGIYNMKTKSFRYGILPTDYLTKTANFDWIMECPEDEKEAVRHELKKICNWNDQHLAYYLAMYGYSFTGDAEKQQKLYYLRGQLAKNGKSVMLEVLSDIFDEVYVKKLELGFFDERAPDRHKTMAGLKGIRLAWTNEVSKKRADANFIKDIADGTKIPYRVMYGTTTTLNVQFKVVLVSNNTLDIAADNGIDRRLVLCQFDSSFRAGENGTEAVDDYEKRVFVADELFATKMKTVWRNALLHLIMDASYDYIQNGMPPIPEEWDNDKKDMIADNTPFRDFFETNFIVGDGLTISKSIIESVLANYKIEKVGMKGLKDELKKMSIPYTYNKDKMVKGVKGVFTGFALREQDEEL
jgi:phage/plasmid-associated DNA primase